MHIYLVPTNYSNILAGRKIQKQMIRDAHIFDYSTFLDVEN